VTVLTDSMPEAGILIGSGILVRRFVTRKQRRGFRKWQFRIVSQNSLQTEVWHVRNFIFTSHRAKKR
jgi:hypothetical protein